MFVTSKSKIRFSSQIHTFQDSVQCERDITGSGEEENDETLQGKDENPLIGQQRTRLSRVPEGTKRFIKYDPSEVIIVCPTNNRFLPFCE